jgi:hypothetical protein
VGASVGIDVETATITGAASPGLVSQKTTAPAAKPTKSKPRTAATSGYGQP